MRQVIIRLTKHLNQLVHCGRNLLPQQNKQHEADIDDIESTDQLIRNRLTYIPLLECDVRGQCLGRWRCIKRYVEANKLR